MWLIRYTTATLTPHSAAMRVCLASNSLSASSVLFEKTSGSSCCVCARWRGSFTHCLLEILRAHTHTGIKELDSKVFPRGVHIIIIFTLCVCCTNFVLFSELSSFCIFNSSVRFRDFIHVGMEYEEFPRERLSRFWGKSIYISVQIFELNLLNI